MRVRRSPQPASPQDAHRRRGGARAWLVALAALVGIALLDAHGAPRTEENVKSSYVVLFAEHVRWPGDEAGDGDDTDTDEDDNPFVIAILGEDSLGPDLDLVARPRRVDGRRIEVRRVASSAEARRAQLVYIGRGEERRAAVWLDELQDCPALIVTELPSTLESGAGVVIDLVPVAGGGRRVRFDVNLTAVQQRGLQVAAPMLQAARRIIGGPNRGN